LYRNVRFVTLRLFYFLTKRCGNAAGSKSRTLRYNRIVDRAALLVKVINVQRAINREILIIRLITTRPPRVF
jgi:hypothetical protein